MTNKLPLDSVFEAIQEGVTTWKAKNTKSHIEKKVTDLLDKNAKTIILKLLGFDDQWSNEWKIDHCNGRQGNSTMSNYLENISAAKVKEWMNSVEFPAVDADISSALKKEYLTMYESKQKYAITQKIEQLVNESTDAFIAQLAEDTALTAKENFKKLMEK